MLHINNPNDTHILAIAAIQPSVVLVLNPPVGYVARIKAVSPRTKVIVRYHVRDQDIHATYLYCPRDMARQAGRNAAQICIARRAEQPQADAWVVLNEPPSETLDQVERLADFDIGYMEALHEVGMRGVIGTFSVGTPKLPSDDGGASLRAYAPALRRAVELDAWLGLHQYIAARPARGGVTPSGWVHDPRYYALRWQLVIIPWLKSQGIPIPYYVITETGFDAGPAKNHGYTGNEVGYKIAEPWGYGDSEEGARAYLADLLWLFGEYAKDPRCLGVCIFAAGDNGDWKWWSFMVDGYLLNLMMRTMFPTFGVETPAPPTGGGQQMSELGNRVAAALKARLGARFQDMRGTVQQHATRRFDEMDSRRAAFLALHYATGARTVSVEAIARYHVQTNGWAGIGYHFVLRLGIVYYVGDVNTMRAHVENRNDEALGVCVTGTYPNDVLAAEDLDALRHLVAVLDAVYGHQKELKGHGQLLPGHTACPGTLVTAIPSMRGALPPTAPPPSVDWAKVVYEGEAAERRQTAEGRPATAAWIRANWTLPAIAKRDGTG